MTPDQKALLTVEQQRHVRTVAQLLYKVIDRYEYGDDKDGDPKPCYTSNQLQTAWRSPRRATFVKKITDNAIAVHLFLGKGEVHYYYNSNRRGRHALVGFDVDAHNGEIDAEQVAELVARHVGVSYWETSTHGRGLHGFLLVDKLKATNRANQRLQCVCRELEAQLRRMKNEAGYGSSIEVKGYAGRVEGKKLIRAPLMKIPKLDTTEKLERFKRNRGMTIDALERLVACEGRGGSDQARGERGRRKLVTNASYRTAPDTDSLTHIAAIPSVGPRQNAACRYLARQLGRPPTLDEFEAFYLDHDLYTPPVENPRRRRNLEAALAFTEQTFDCTRGSGEPITLDRCRQLVASVSDATRHEALKVAKVGRGQLTDEDLALTLYAHTVLTLKPKDGRRFTVPHDAVKAIWRRQHEQADTERGYRKQIVVAARHALIADGLLTLISNDYIPRNFAKDGRGVAKRFGLGVRHPLHGLFESMAKEVRAEDRGKVMA